MMNITKIVIQKKFAAIVEKKLLNNEETPFDIRLFDTSSNKIKSPQRIDFIIVFNEKTITINTMLIINKRHSANIRRGTGFQDVPVISYSLLCTETFEVLSTVAMQLDSFDLRDYKGNSDYYGSSILFTIRSDDFMKRFNLIHSGYPIS